MARVSGRTIIRAKIDTQVHIEKKKTATKHWSVHLAPRSSPAASSNSCPPSIIVVNDYYCMNNPVQQNLVRTRRKPGVTREKGMREVLRYPGRAKTPLTVSLAMAEPTEFTTDRRATPASSACLSAFIRSRVSPLWETAKNPPYLRGMSVKRSSPASIA